MTSTQEAERAAQDVRDALAMLQRKFADKFPERLSTIESHFARARAGDVEALADAIQATHKLRGTSGTFGQPAIGELAGRAEDALIRCRERGDEPSWDAAASAIESLRDQGLALAER